MPKKKFKPAAAQNIHHRRYGLCSFKNLNRDLMEITPLTDGGKLICREDFKAETAVISREISTDWSYTNAEVY